MWSALGQLLPLAVAAAISTVPIMVTILILLSSRGRKVAIPFLVGWVAGMAGVVVLAALGASALPLAPVRAAQTAIGITEIIVGVGVLVVAAVAWRRAARGPVDTPNRWLGTVERLGPVTAAGLGVALNLRPKGLLLAAAAGLSIAGARLTASEAVLVAAVYLVLSTCSVTAPIVVTLASPATMQPRLVSTRDWLGRNGGHITVLVLLLVGVVVLGAGLGRLDV